MLICNAAVRRHVNVRIAGVAAAAQSTLRGQRPLSWLATSRFLQQSRLAHTGASTDGSSSQSYSRRPKWTPSPPKSKRDADSTSPAQDFSVTKTSEVVQERSSTRPSKRRLPFEKFPDLSRNYVARQHKIADRVRSEISRSGEASTFRSGKQEERRIFKREKTAADALSKLSPEEAMLLREDMKWVGIDPRKLASKVQVILEKKDDLDRAMRLINGLRKNISATVAYNNVFDYLLGKGKVQATWKLFNDMKKSGVPQNTYTYTILLRGLANNAAEVPTATEKALSIYKSISSQKSGVKLITMHTNAVLNVCARANDMDALFEVAGGLPQAGAGAPDLISYTIILNALLMQARENSYGQRPGEPGTFSNKRKMESIRKESAKPESEDPQRALKRKKAVTDGRQIWADITHLWSMGRLEIDEKLINAMGQLLLASGSSKDWDDIFSLVEQTHYIPRQTPKLNRSVDKNDDAWGTNTAQDGFWENELPEGKSFEDEVESEPSKEAVLEQVFQPITFKNKQTQSRAIQPTSSTLSLVIRACDKLRLFSAAKTYWSVLTTPDQTSRRQAVSPDAANIAEYLRILRISRSSAEALRVITDNIIVEESSTKQSREDRRERRNKIRLEAAMAKRAILIAMSACVRDLKNPNVMDTAGKLVDIMGKLGAIRPDVLQRYIDLAMAPVGPSQEPNRRRQPSRQDEDATTKSYGSDFFSDPLPLPVLSPADPAEIFGFLRERTKNMLGALKRLQPHLQAYDVFVLSRMQAKPENKDMSEFDDEVRKAAGAWGRMRPEERQQILPFLERVQAAYDHLIPLLELKAAGVIRRSDREKALLQAIFTEYGYDLKKLADEKNAVVKLVGHQQRRNQEVQASTAQEEVEEQVEDEDDVEPWKRRSPLGQSWGSEFESPASEGGLSDTHDWVGPKF